MATTLSTTTSKARKIHQDHGGQYFDFCIRHNSDKEQVIDLKEIHHLNMSEEEIKSIQKSIDNNWKILPGEKYIKQAAVDGGDFWVFKSKVEIYNIIDKYHLFRED